MRIQFVIALGCSVPLFSTAQISTFTLDTSPTTVTITFNAPRGLPTPTVTGAPYSADQVTESVQTLADGTHINQTKNVRHITRDSRGRTRTERPILVTRGENGWNLTVPEIRDPVDGLYYILDQQNNVAHRFATPSTPTPAAVTRPAASPQAQDGAAMPKRVSDGVHPDFSIEKLGNQMIEGVMVKGDRTTLMWPVGTQGNDRPIVTTHEFWFSEELKIYVIEKTSDPRFGENTFKLTNLERTEPDPALLQVPPDYTIVEEKGSFKMTATRH
jgi:hypothetical protein